MQCHYAFRIWVCLWCGIAYSVIIVVDNKKKETIWPFLWMGCNCLETTEPLWRDNSLLVPRTSWYLLNWPWKGKKLSWSSSRHNVHPLQILSAGGLNLLLNFQKVWLDKTLIFRGGLVRKGCDLFEGGCNFHVKTKTKI